ncbi:MAG: hypothetical protein CMG90_01955 [Marinobacter sp.]|nr:hypothetical protein [Marinobacter sp.]|tara:strand:+ start:823 stop:1800 length:978 start_codon:yes stop_codon:yes gene_type:complete
MSFKSILFDIVKPCGLFSFTKRVAKGHPRILMYHRISGSSNDGGLPVDIFRKQIKTIKNSFNVTTIPELISSYANGDPIQDAVVVTFDDGYHDFADYAFPVLQEEAVPAVLFATTGFIDSDLWLWPDQIRYAVEHRGNRSINISGVQGSLGNNISDHNCWNAIADHCLKLAPNQRKGVISELYENVEIPLPDRAPDQFRSLSWGQIKDMKKLGLSVESHSYSHPVLTTLTEQEIFEELRKSKETIKDELGSDVEGFCYPNGMKCDFDKRVKRALVGLGYQWAVTAYPTPSPLSDLFEISRYNAGPSMDDYLKTVFGVKYLSMRLG